MKTAWHVLGVVCAIGNAIWTAATWMTGGKPDWFVWMMAIVGCLYMAGYCFDRIIETRG